MLAGVAANRPSMTYPRWATEEYATRRFTSPCFQAQSAAYRMPPSTATPARFAAVSPEASGKRPMLKRRYP